MSHALWDIVWMLFNERMTQLKGSAACVPSTLRTFVTAHQFMLTRSANVRFICLFSAYATNRYWCGIWLILIACQAGILYEHSQGYLAWFYRTSRTCTYNFRWQLAWHWARNITTCTQCCIRLVARDFPHEEIPFFLPVNLSRCSILAWTGKGGHLSSACSMFSKPQHTFLCSLQFFAHCANLIMAKKSNTTNMGKTTKQDLRWNTPPLVLFGLSHPCCIAVFHYAFFFSFDSSPLSIFTYFHFPHVRRKLYKAKFETFLQTLGMKVKQKNNLMIIKLKMQLQKQVRRRLLINASTMIWEFHSSTPYENFQWLLKEQVYSW